MASAAEALSAFSTAGKRVKDNISRQPTFVRGLVWLVVTLVAAVFYIEALRIILAHNRPPRGEFLWGAIVGLLYAMVAFGLILVHRANRIINFAQAELGP